MTKSKFLTTSFSKESISGQAESEQKLTNWPVVYTIFNQKRIYVGETSNFEMRMRQHLDSGTKSDLTKVTAILNDSFNKSACLDLESQLIKFLFADEQFEVMNLNSGIVDSDYFERAAYRAEFNVIFEQLIADNFLTRSIDELVNTDLFKYSPYKSLNADQGIAVQHILETLVTLLQRPKTVPFVVEGGPGTGKTIVAIYLMKLLADIRDASDSELIDGESMFSELFLGENRDWLSTLRNCALVIPQQSLRTSLKKVFHKTPGLSKDMVMSPFDMVKTNSKFDLVIVDEAHRLQRRANQSSATLNKDFAAANIRMFGSDDKSRTQLDWVFAKSRHTVLLVDTLQSVKPADLSLSTIRALVGTAKIENTHFVLSSQMRIQGGDNYVEFVTDLLSGKGGQTPVAFGNYRLELFESVAEMRAEILRLNAEVGLSRMLAGYAWPWVSKKDPSSPDIKIDGLELFWNRTAQDWVNSPNSHEEVGSIHTIQGYDLNFAGVIIGNDLTYDFETDRIVFNRANYFDKKGLENNPTLGLTFGDEEIREYVLNVYRVLLTRGIRGTFIHAVDPALQAYLRRWISA